MGRRIEDGAAVSIYAPNRRNDQHKNKTGIIKRSDLLLGGIWNYTVEFDDGTQASVDEYELRIVRRK